MKRRSELEWSGQFMNKSANMLVLVSTYSRPNKDQFDNSGVLVYVVHGIFEDNHN